ncbi:hypothetical protein ES319_D05G423500v1 [Gossypium barbadense]|uniref:Pectate lyase domain-containing protein n=1 Tax=Gossypium barbadense TaxID=3634 RepID=A0A5J5RS06_GOSBA|nr:hypothetical protein ES319_D05G423500v1 [Gossypium barbadense]
MARFYLVSLLICLHATSTFSRHVPQQISEPVPRYSTRRQLDTEQCRTGNLIDDCWRCDPEWEANRKKLTDCAVGFGKNAIGGRDGDVYVVTDSGNAMVWDPFPHSGSDGDGISIFGSRDVWIDHCTLANCYDGLIDATYGSTSITISNNYMLHHNEVMLMGHSDEFLDDKNMQVTIAFNYFGEGLVQRMPRCRHGYFHIVNNVYTGWQMYAIGGSANPTINSQGNVFVASDNNYSKEVTKRESYFDEWKNWNWRSEGDMMLNGAFFTPSGQETSESYIKASSMVARPSSLLTQTAQYAGTLRCRKGYGC